VVTIYGTGTPIASNTIVIRTTTVRTNMRSGMVIAICNTYTNSIGMNLANAKAVPCLILRRINLRRIEMRRFILRRSIMRRTSVRID